MKTKYDHIKTMILGICITAICLSCKQNSTEDIVINHTENHMAAEGTNL